MIIGAGRKNLDECDDVLTVTIRLFLQVGSHRFQKRRTVQSIPGSPTWTASQILEAPILKNPLRH